MKYEKYESLSISKDALEFKFVSMGPKGEIQKVVQFIETENPDIYNLAFGDLMPHGEVNDAVKNDNKDRNKVLATVAAAIYEFTVHYSEKYVFFTGSTPERTRLYRMALANNLDELNVDFEIYGVILMKGLYFIKPFVKGVGYLGFLIKRKIN
jgi:hypothetical protein